MFSDPWGSENLNNDYNSGPTVGGGNGVRVSTIKNRPSHHKFKSPKHFLLLAYFETSELKGYKST